jgi:hypothetical protein
MHVDYSSSLTSEDVSVSTIQELSPFFTKSLYSIQTDHAYSRTHYITLRDITLRDKDISIIIVVLPKIAYHQNVHGCFEVEQCTETLCPSCVRQAVLPVNQVNFAFPLRNDGKIRSGVTFGASIPIVELFFMSQPKKYILATRSS